MRSRRKSCRCTTTRNARGLSPEWVRRCRHAMATVIPRFNMRRTVRDYARGMYLPAAAHGARLLADAGAGAAAARAWKRRVRERWKRCAHPVGTR